MSGELTPGAPAAPIVAQPTGTPAAETPKAPEVAPKPVEDTSSKRFAALAKKEKAIQRQNEEIKSHRAQIERERAEFEKWKTSKAEEDQLWERNPIDALSKKNWNYEKLTNLVLAGETPPPEMVAKLAAKEEIKSWQDQQAAKERETAEKAAKEAEAQGNEALQQFRTEVREHIAANSEKYEYCSLFEGGDLIVELVQQHYLSTKKVLSQDEACDMAEKYFESLVDKATATKKHSAKALPQPKAEDKQSKQAPSRTLTNQLTPSTPAQRPLTRDERIKRALAVEVKK